MAEAEFANETVEMNDAQRKARRSRNVALAFCLIGFVSLLFIATMAKIATNLAEKGL